MEKNESIESILTAPWTVIELEKLADVHVKSMKGFLLKKLSVRYPLKQADTLETSMAQMRIDEPDPEEVQEWKGFSKEIKDAWNNRAQKFNAERIGLFQRLPQELTSSRLVDHVRTSVMFDWQRLKKTMKALVSFGPHRDFGEEFLSIHIEIISITHSWTLEALVCGASSLNIFFL